MALEVRHRDEVLTVASERGLCVARWADSPQPRHFPIVTAAMRAAAEPRAALLNVVDARGKLPRFNDEVRRAAAEMARALAPISMGTAHVLLLDGFTGAAVRMFLSTLTLLARGGPATTVHSSVAEGAAWLAAHAPSGHSAQTIEAAYASLRG
jgi:hypothetical protein